MKKALYVFFLCLILVSCANHDEGFTTVEGILVDGTNKSPLPGYELVFRDSPAGITLGNGKLIEMAIVVTDAEGKFSYQFYASSDRRYGIELRDSTSKYYSGYTPIEKAKKNNLTIEAKSRGVLKLRILNESPIDTAEEFYVSAMGGTRQNFFMKDTTVYAVSSAGYENTLVWEIKSKANLAKGEYKYIPKPHDTSAFTIRY